VKRIVSLLSVVALSAIGLTAGEVVPPRKAPELAFKVPGQGDKLLSQYKGKVVALELVFTTCPHCQHASQVMTKIQNDLSSKGLQAIDVAFNDNADLLVENFAKDFNVGFPVGWTTRSEVLKFLNLSVMDRFVVPQFVLIDRNGMIHYQTAPLGDDAIAQESFLRNQIEGLLTQPSTKAHSTSVHKAASAPGAALAKQ
jgi:cytochrome oxidase Cu insertion factor (SCO1/SenC/PrrC family)